MFRDLYFRREWKYENCSETQEKGSQTPPGKHRGFGVCPLLALLSMLVLWLIHNSAFLRPSVEVSILIEKSAEEQHVSPSLLQAVILTESKFDAKAVSHVGAVGMMQLMPETAEWISEESGLPADDLNRPDENIPLGAWYLNFLLKKYHNNEVLALAAYNAGRGNVDEWVEKYNWGEGFSKVDEIPS